MDKTDFLAEMAVRLPANVDVELIFHKEPEDHHHVTAYVKAETKGACLAAAQAVLSMVKGKLVFVRVVPEADEQYDIQHMTWGRLGYVRFYFKDEPGEAYLLNALDSLQGLQPRQTPISELRKYEWPA